MSKIGSFEELSVFVECSTCTTPTMDALKKYIDILSEFGYTQLYLGLTDAYKIEGEPYFNFCRGGYTTEQLQEIDAYAFERGIELRANVQTLAHMIHMHQHECYADLFDTLEVMLVGKEEVYQFIDKIFATMSKSIRSRIIHIGMDEAWDLGAGRYFQEHGYVDKKTILLYHLQRVVEIAKKYDYTCEIWSDMFFRMLPGSTYEDGIVPDDVRAKIPEGVRLVHWKYHKMEEDVLRKQIAQNKSLCDELVFAGGAWKWSGLAPSNKYSIETMETQMAICQEQGVNRFMVTLWSDRGGHCSIFAVLPALFAVTELASGKKITDIDKARFKEIVGVAYDDFMLLDHLNNPFFKEIGTLNNRCYWGFLSDMFTGSYDLLLDEHSDEAYAKLADLYAAVEAGDYQQMFDDYKLYAKVLSIKMNLGVKIRQAYHDGNKELLYQYAKVDIPELIVRMREFINNFNKRWLSENMAFGLEVHHLYYGGQIERWTYTAERLLEYLEDGLPIEEMEREERKPSLVPERGEDSLEKYTFNNLISYCNYW